MSEHIIPDASKIPATWQKSSVSGANGDCVEFAAHPNGVAIRHSKAPDGPALLFTHSEIAAMLAGAKAGEFDHFAQS
ncbi:DUF397 domain-containing protein [Streptomyces ipomoeae]|jgi:hypothetical protein|uniref:DUF397 domain-containing protein n=2 Tax=Streptomyces ipomoeae TaxID=103232 RepID=A0AAE9AYP3_9ACTN|nr:DUF397 domain-containing protein [Streptomyces ipomoeae]EKX61432.1 putative toxin-antitoxin system, toxin component [Streptomyces ipomoeae 91-03]MDX2697624.1 DUF397 domain-containing protein [Streptomyces ipomoeae]MDX2825065.1 DUF397 domain-containing protein [Streptomyces ipomoeae]MDX2843400.1 DUF397 domain-containing protein [Streptomyces ipomoeae]MDX2877639.1 DUF397 domain-containing protein [Streptomyces ipomoeae]